MTDQDLINQAYEDSIKQLFAVLLDESIVAKDPEAVSQAEQRFKAGILKTREVRDRAIALIP